MDYDEVFLEASKINLLLNQDDIFLNEDKFRNPHNVLLITGLAGSGKSTLARQLEIKYSATLIELDNFEKNGGHHRATPCPFIIEYKKLHPELSEYFEDLWMNVGEEKFNEELVKYIRWLFSKVDQNKKKVYVIEGLQIYCRCYELFDELIGKPMIIVGTSSMTSFIRRLKRDLSQREIKNVIAFTKFVIKFIRTSHNMSFKHREYLNKFIELMETDDSNSSEEITEGVSHVEITICNSSEKAINDTKWSNPGAKLFNDIIDASNRNELIRETYLVWPSGDIAPLYPRARPSYSSSGCKYPHHRIVDGELRVSVAGVKAAYSRARQQGAFTGKVKEHLVKHYKELDIYEDSTMVVNEQIESNFDNIEDYVREVAMKDFPSKDNERTKFIPVYGIVRGYTHESIRNDGTPKTDSELSASNFNRIIKRLTRGDNYSHALISLDDKFTNMYSFDDEGFVEESIMVSGHWLGTASVYVTVLFVTEEEFADMVKYIAYLKENQKTTEYALGNLVKMFIGRPSKMDKRFVCSTIVGYLMHMGNFKNLHRDYSRIRPEDITILPRAFYVMNFKDRQDFIDRRSEFRRRVKEIYSDARDELEEYNNQLPKLVLQEKFDRLGTIDKIFAWIIDRIPADF